MSTQKPRSSSPPDRREERVQWLLKERPQTLALFKGREIGHFTSGGQELAQQMKDAGLFSAKTYVADIRWENYVKEALRRQDELGRIRS